MPVGVKTNPVGSVRKKFSRYSGTSNYNIAASARKGISTSLFYDLADVIKMSEKTLAQIIHISPRTISNYKADKKSLDPVQSEHLLKLVSLYEKGEELFGNIDEFNYWLQKPFVHIQDKPADWLVTPGGVTLVMDELVKLAHGDAI